MKPNRMTRMAAMFHIQVQEFRRDLGGIFLSFAFPFVFILSLLATSMMNPVVKFKIGIVDSSHNVHAQVLVDALSATASVEAQSVARAAGLAAIKDGTLHAMVVIPSGDFRQGAAKLELVVAERYQPIADIIMQATSARMAGDQGRSMRFEVTNPEGKVDSEFTFVFPGILAVALLQMGLFLTAVPLLQARDRGTYRYLSLTPLSIPEFLLSQMAFRYIIAMTQIGLLLCAGSFVLKLSPMIWITVLAAAGLGVLLMVSLGYLIAGTAPSLQVGMAMVMFAEFAMITGGNVFWDTKTSDLLFYVAHVIPLSYLADLFRQIITGAPGMWPIWLDVLAIFGWSGAALALTARNLRLDTAMQGSAGRAPKAARLATAAP
jgi:ABC-2 type transport system permease protein